MNPFTFQMFSNRSIVGHFITRRMASQEHRGFFFSFFSKLNKGESLGSPGVCAVGMRLSKTPQVTLSAFLYIYTITRARRSTMWTYFVQIEFNFHCQKVQAFE